jgi:hypothetical protein
VIYGGAKQQMGGKSLLMINMLKYNMLMKKSVVVATADQKSTIKLLSGHFPKALFELVGTWGVKIHEKP